MTRLRWHFGRPPDTCAGPSKLDTSKTFRRRRTYNADASLGELVESVRALPYGRPSDRTVAGMLRERRGTCSTKHLFLAEALAERFPETDPLIVHRVYTLD